MKCLAHSRTFIASPEVGREHVIYRFQPQILAQVIEACPKELTDGQRLSSWWTRKDSIYTHHLGRLDAQGAPVGETWEHQYNNQDSQFRMQKVVPLSCAPGFRVEGRWISESELEVGVWKCEGAPAVGEKDNLDDLTFDELETKAGQMSILNDIPEGYSSGDLISYIRAAKAKKDSPLEPATPQPEELPHEDPPSQPSLPARSVRKSKRAAQELQHPGT